MPDEPGTTGTVESPQTDQAAPETTAPAPDTAQFDRLMEKVDSIGQSVQQWQQQQPQPDAQPEVDDVQQILQELGLEPDQEPDIEQQAEDLNLTPQQFVELVMQVSRQATQAELERTVHPHFAAQQETALDSAFVDLEGKYPKLLDEEWQGKVLDTAETLAQSTGDPAWLENPQFVELVHKSLLADELAAQETPATATDEGFEHPRGANPQTGEESDQERADRIVAAGPDSALRSSGFFGKQ